MKDGKSRCQRGEAQDHIRRIQVRSVRRKRVLSLLLGVALVERICQIPFAQDASAALGLVWEALCVRMRENDTVSWNDVSSLAQMDFTVSITMAVWSRPFFKFRNKKT